jgi:uncharacterized protein (TIGR02757 family)
VTPRYDPAIARALDDLCATLDVPSRLAADPVVVVHEQRGELDRELVALVASSLAFGGAGTIREKAREVVARLGAAPTRVAEDPRATRRRLDGFKHRVFLGEDVARLLVGARRLQREEGSLGAAFARSLARAPGAPEAGAEGLRSALFDLVEAIRELGGFPARGSTARRGPAHLLPDVHGGGACKRLLLFLRWMVRRADGVDLGLWPISPEVLLCPVDTHIEKIGRNLGFTAERAASWRAAEEITAHLRQYDPSDPVRFDFALCHLGMVQRCRERRDAAVCEGCKMKPVCRHWRRAPRLLRSVVRP